MGFWLSISYNHKTSVGEDLRLTNLEYLTPLPFPYHLVLNCFKLTDHCSSNLALLIEQDIGDAGTSGP
jgi:hypothetical protein